MQAFKLPMGAAEQLAVGRQAGGSRAGSRWVWAGSLFQVKVLLLWARTGWPGIAARLGDGLLVASLSWGQPMGTRKFGAKESSLSPFQAPQQVPDEFVPGRLEPGDSGSP